MDECTVRYNSIEKDDRESHVCKIKGVYEIQRPKKYIFFEIHHVLSYDTNASQILINTRLNFTFFFILYPRFSLLKFYQFFPIFSDIFSHSFQYSLNLSPIGNFQQIRWDEQDWPPLLYHKIIHCTLDYCSFYYSLTQKKTRSNSNIYEMNSNG